jgi:L-lactate dehydrogenase (cytochrome)
MSEFKFSLQEVSQHSTHDDAWLVINGTVWDVTGFAPRHPGGEKVIEEHFGKDASEAYNDVHSPKLAASYFTKEKEMGQLEGVPRYELSTAPKRSQNPKLTSKPPALMNFINLRDFEDAARDSLNERSWIYISGSADGGYTAVANSKIYERTFLRPRVLNPVNVIDLSTTIQGHKYDVPIFNAPASLAMLAHPSAEIALAKGLANSGSTIIIPTLSSYSLDEVVEALPRNHPFFFQLYVNRDDITGERILNDLQRLKPSAIIITFNLPVFSKREANERNGIKLHQEKMEVISEGKALKKKGSNQARSSGAAIKLDLTWEYIRKIKERTDIPIHVKGIQSAEDAVKSLHCGCAGIYISNHGGRAVDTAQPTLLTLAEIRLRYPQVLRKMDVFIDGGVRRGTDVLKALCLGASGVCIGRPLFYALIYGQDGVEHLMDCE